MGALSTVLTYGKIRHNDHDLWVILGENLICSSPHEKVSSTTLVEKRVVSNYNINTCWVGY